MKKHHFVKNSDTSLNSYIAGKIDCSSNAFAFFPLTSLSVKVLMYCSPDQA